MDDIFEIDLQMLFFFHVQIFRLFNFFMFDNMLGVPYPVFTRAHLWLVVWIWTIGARPLEPKVLV